MKGLREGMQQHRYNDLVYSIVLFTPSVNLPPKYSPTHTHI